MSTKKSWRDRLGGHPHLPDVGEIPLSMRDRHGEDIAKQLPGTR